MKRCLILFICLIYTNSTDSSTPPSRPASRPSGETPSSKGSPGATPSPRPPYYPSSSPESPQTQQPSTPSRALQSIQPINIPVLQQDSSTRFTRGTSNIEALKILDIPGLIWKHVREEESLNCGYHAFYNISMILQDLKSTTPSAMRAQQQQLLNPNSFLRQSLMNPSRYLDFLGTAIPQIYQLRESNILKALQSFDATFKTKTALPKSSMELQKIKQQMQEKGKELESCIHGSQFYIKTNNLQAGEIEALIRNEFSARFNNILTIDLDFNMLGMGGMTLSGLLTDTNISRIDQFLNNTNDVIGVLYNEYDFHHWVGYLLYKINGEITTFCFNSIDQRTPTHIDQLFNMISGVQY